jgi:hypothetical protein
MPTQRKSDMAETFLSQDLANGLISMRKQRKTEEVYYFPGSGDSRILPLVSEDFQESFSLDIARGNKDASKIKYQNRGRDVVVLLRIDLKGHDHCNPDGSEVPCPHLHIYKQGYADKWAYPIPTEFTNPSDKWQMLNDFMHYCNIIRPPNIQKGADEWND